MKLNPRQTQALAREIIKNLQEKNKEISADKTPEYKRYLKALEIYNKEGLQFNKVIESLKGTLNTNSLPRFYKLNEPKIVYFANTNKSIIPQQFQVEDMIVLACIDSNDLDELKSNVIKRLKSKNNSRNGI